jgi:Mg-chelatase subunit ChlD
MRSRVLIKARAPLFLVAGCLGALASVGCGEEDPAGRTGGGLQASGGKGGKGGTGSGGSKSGNTGGSLAVGGTSTGGSSGSISVGGASGTSGSSSGGTQPLTDGSACAAVSRESNKTEVALLFMVDISGSMNCGVPEADPPCTTDPSEEFDNTRWTNMAPALKTFFSSPDSVGMWAGISFFSRNDSCDADDYEEPDAEIALLPGSAAAINGAIDDQRPRGYTPTVPSLQGALTHAEDWAEDHPDQNVVVVYATDGYPKGCDDNSIDLAADIAAESFQGEHNVRTYVLGVGPNLTDLNQIAQSGGTGEASFIDTGADVTAQLVQKFNEIRTAVAVECTYSVPTPPAGQTLDPNKVNVNYTSGSDEKAIGYNGAASCSEGWQYTDNMTKIVLCGSTCEEVKADPDASIQVLFGCQTVNIDDPR